MHEILRNLGEGDRVLDLGSGPGSFAAELYPWLRIIRLDAEFPSPMPDCGCVQANGAQLPFAAGSFKAIVSNHSLEHMAELKSVLREIGRVAQPDAALYVAVPDGSTISDRLYRWIYHGGGHVNLFRSAADVIEQIVGATSLPTRAVRVLHTSLGFLARRHFRPRPPRRLYLLANGNLRFIAMLNYALRKWDRLFNTRASVYGWAFYFGDVREPVEEGAWTNICVACGAGHSAALLATENILRRSPIGIASYGCPDCGAWNLFTVD